MHFKRILSVLTIVFLSLTLFSGCGEENKNSDAPSKTEINNQTARKTIVIVGENENTGFWNSLKKGGEEAAKKYGYRLEYIGTDEGATNVSYAHTESIGSVISEGVSGVVVAPRGEGYSDIYGKLYDNKIPVVQIDRLTEDDFDKLESNKKNPVVSTVITSYKEAGAVCAEKIFEKTKEEITKSDSTFVVGIIKKEESFSDEQKALGFVEKFTELADADAKTQWKYKIETKSESKYEDSMSELVEDKAKAVFITRPVIADKVSDIVFIEKEKYDEIIFCGFDSGAKQLKWLNNENGPEFIGGFAQDSFNLGFNAVEQCVFAIEGKENKEQVEIAGQWYDKSNAEKMKQDNFIFEK